MKKVLVLLILAMSFSAFPQEGDVKEYPVIDESSLTFEPAGDGAAPEGNLTDNLDGTGISASDYIRMVFFLIIVIVIIWLFIKLLRRYSGNRFGDQDMINVMGSQTLTAETSLMWWKWRTVTTCWGLPRAMWP